MRLALMFAHYSNRLGGLFLTIEEGTDVVVVREELIMGGSGSVRQSTELAIGVASGCWSVFGLGLATTTCASPTMRLPIARSTRYSATASVRSRCHRSIVCARADLEVPNLDADRVARLARRSSSRLASRLRP